MRRYKTTKLPGFYDSIKMTFSLVIPLRLCEKEREIMNRATSDKTTSIPLISSITLKKRCEKLKNVKIVEAKIFLYTFVGKL